MGGNSGTASATKEDKPAEWMNQWKNQSILEKYRDENCGFSIY